MTPDRREGCPYDVGVFTRVQTVTLAVALLATAGSLTIVLASPEWRACAGDPVPGRGWLALFGLVIAGLAVAGGAASRLSQPVRPIGRFVSCLAAFGLTGSAVIAVFLVFWGHFANICNGG